MLSEKSSPNFPVVTWAVSRILSSGFEPVRALSYRFVSTCTDPGVPPSLLPPLLDPELPEPESVPPELPDDPPELPEAPPEPLEVDPSAASGDPAPSGAPAPSVVSAVESIALASLPGLAAPAPHAGSSEIGATASAASVPRDFFGMRNLWLVAFRIR